MYQSFKIREDDCEYLLEVYMTIIKIIKRYDHDVSSKNLSILFKSDYVLEQFDLLGDGISCFSHRFPKEYEANFIIEMFYDIYRNYNNYKNSYNFFLSKITDHINTRCLFKNLKIWKVSTFPIEEYVDNIICSNIPPQILNKYEHPNLLKYIRNRNFETFILGCIDRKSNIFKYFSGSHRFDKNLIVEIKKFI
jgi:hypothetical protein